LAAPFMLQRLVAASVTVLYSTTRMRHTVPCGTNARGLRM